MVMNLLLDKKFGNCIGKFHLLTVILVIDFFPGLILTIAKVVFITGKIAFCIHFSIGSSCI